MSTLFIVTASAIALLALGVAWRRGGGKLALAATGFVIALALLALIMTSAVKPPRCEFGNPVDLPKLPHPAGYVYVIHDTEYSKSYKIGRTINPSSRISDIRNILPGESDIVAIIDTQDAPTLEWQLHQRYADSRKRGEWFALNDTQVREICDI